MASVKSMIAASLLAAPCADAFVTPSASQTSQGHGVSGLRGSTSVQPESRFMPSALAAASAGAIALSFVGSQRMQRPLRQQKVVCNFSAETQIGAMEPLGYFDPLDLCKDEATFKDFRAKEIKHGRLGGGVALVTDPLRRHGARGLSVACRFMPPQSSTEALHQDLQATVEVSAQHSVASLLLWLTRVMVLEVDARVVDWGVLDTCGFRMHTAWSMSMKAWQKLMHAINGNSAASAVDPWASYLAAKQPAVRAKWEEGLTIEAGQLEANKTEVKQIAAGLVTVDAEGVALITVKTLEVIAKVRSTKALAIVLPGCKLTRHFFDALGLNESAVTTGMLRVLDSVTKHIDLKSVTVVNLGAVPITFRKLSSSLQVPTEASEMIMAELDSRYLTQELKNELSRNARATIQQLILSMLPASTKLSAFDFFGWHKRDQGDHIVHGVKFLVPSSQMEEVLGTSGIAQPVFLRHFVETGSSPKHSFSLQWLKGRTYAEVKSLASSTQGIVGIALSKGGLGVRVKEDAVSAVRSMVVPDAPSFTSVNRGVMVREHYEIHGVPREVRVSDLIDGLAKWGWKVVPVKSWTMLGNPKLLVWLVGAQNPPVEKTIELTTHSAVIKEAQDKSSAADAKPKGKGTRGKDKSTGKGKPKVEGSTKQHVVPGPPPGLLPPVMQSTVHPKTLEEVKVLTTRLDKMESRQDKLEQATRDQGAKIDNMNNDMSANFAKLFAMLGAQGEAPNPQQDAKRFRSEGGDAKK